jgi:very-short-patch-repair endonuclease
MISRIKIINKKNKKGLYKKHIDYRHALNNVYRDEILKKPTKAELIVKEWLDENAKDIGIKKRVMFQKGFLVPFHRIVDFYIPRENIIIEIDGGYHNDIKEKDARKDFVWLMRWMKTIRITNEQVYGGEFKKIIDELKLPTIKIKPKLTRISLGKYGFKDIDLNN